MKITGRFEELYFLFRQATQSNASLMHFSPNGNVWILYETKSYLFMRSQLGITDSMIITPNVFENLYRFLKNKRNNKKKVRIKNPGYDLHTVEIATDFIRFCYDDNLRTNIFTRLERDSAISDLSERLRGLAVSMLEMDKPYIRIAPNLIKTYMRRVSDYLSEHDLPLRRKYVFDPHDDETRNELSMDGYQFAIKRNFQEQGLENQKYLFDEGYFVPRFFRNVKVYLSDTDMLFLRRIGMIQNYEDLTIIPFSDHYVIEVNDGDLLFKMSIPRVKHIELKEML